MRDIKFRAWDDVLHKMHYGIEGYYDNLGWDEYPTGSTSHAPNCFGDFLNHDQLHVMQYTGLHDKHGKDGYHKDICQHASGLYIIEWVESDAKFVLWSLEEGVLKDNTLSMRYLEQMTIIGNIYENPELLEAK